MPFATTSVTFIEESSVISEQMRRNDNKRSFGSTYVTVMLQKNPTLGSGEHYDQTLECFPSAQPPLSCLTLSLFTFAASSISRGAESIFFLEMKSRKSFWKEKWLTGRQYQLLRALSLFFFGATLYHPSISALPACFTLSRMQRLTQCQYCLV